MTALASFAIGFLIGLWMSIRILRKQDKIYNDHGVTPINVNPRAFERPSAKLFDPTVAHSMDAKRWLNHSTERSDGHQTVKTAGPVELNRCPLGNDQPKAYEPDAISLSNQLYFDKFFKKK
jgi:hypothetical protein